MSGAVLDTNTISFLMRGDAKVATRLLAHAKADVAVPQPALAEIAYGLARLGRSARSTRLHKRFETLCSELRRVEWSDAVSECFGQIKADLEKTGNRLEDFDIAIAAHALAEDAVLITDNCKQMGRIRGLRVENWKD